MQESLPERVPFSEIEKWENEELIRLIRENEKFIFKSKNALLSDTAFPDVSGQKRMARYMRASDENNYGWRLLSTDRKWRGWREERLKFLRQLIDEFEVVVYRLLKDGNTAYEMRQEGNSPLEPWRELARKLALNLVDVSTSIRDESMPYHKILSKPELVRSRENKQPIPRERFIAVIGAGASNAAFPNGRGVAAADDAYIEILKKVKQRVDLDDELIYQEEQRLLNRIDHEDKANFELKMKALLKFSPELVIEALREVCGQKNLPSLPYEIIAHLLKHRFLDAVINFNYDELLDNAISEELPAPEDLQFVYTAGHCPDELNDWYIDNRIRKPIYIKCHGTLSHQNSLRFSQQDAFVMEPAIQRLMQRLFTAKVPDAPEDQQQELPLNLLVFGCKLDNPVIKRVLSRCLEDNVTESSKKEKITFWIFDISPDRKKELEEAFAQVSHTRRYEVKYVPLSKSGNNQMGLVLKDMWAEINESFKTPYKPKGISRHLLIHHIFKNSTYWNLPHRESGDRVKKYFQDRLYLEIVITALQNEGVIHLKQLADNRAGKFYEKLKNKEGDHDTNLQRYLGKLGMVPYLGFMEDTYYVQEISIRHNPKELTAFFLKKLRSHLSSELAVAFGGTSGEEFSKIVERDLLKRRLAIVNPKYRNIHDNFFLEVRHEDVMNTSLAWVYRYRKLLEKGDWDLMLAITEKGSFLRYDIEEGNFDDKKHFELILSSFGREFNPVRTEIPSDEVATSSPLDDTLKNGLPNLLSGGLLYRPWWMHNKHMVLLLKYKKNASQDGSWRSRWIIKEGFYYTHRMLSRRINPVRIHRSKKDKDKLLTLFAIYWEGAHNFRKNRNISVIFTPAEIKRAIENLLELAAQKLMG